MEHDQSFVLVFSLASPSMFPLVKSPQTYQYGPLPAGNYIRYLVLQPGKESEPLSCDLHTSALADLTDFETISYVWGSSNKVAQVLCAGHGIPITANLRDVLRRVRLPDAPRRLWADSICINQDDRKEKAEQVALMGQIYSHASKTLICLGPDNGHGGSSVASLLGDVFKLTESQLQEFGSWDQVPPLDAKDPLARDARWKFVHKMITSPWFSRVWVVQEAALSRDASVLYGLAQFPRRYLLRTHFWLLFKANFLWLQHGLYLNDIHRSDFWTADKHTNPTQFASFLARAKVLRCTDDRDRIFAFLGLAIARFGPGGDRPIVEPNYTKPYFEVYHEFALEFLRHTNDLSLLSTIDHTPKTLETDSGEPTWVPRWDCILCHDQFGLHDSRFNASKGTKQEKLDFDSCATALRLHGFIIDRVHFRSKGLPRQHPSSSLLARLWQSLPSRMQDLLNSLAELVVPDTTNMKRDAFVELWKYLSCPTTRSAYANGERLRAFVKTLRGGRPHDDEDYRKLGADEASFGLWLCRESGAFDGVVDIAELEEAAAAASAEGGGNDSVVFRTRAKTWYTSRRFVLTNHGYYGLAPGVTREGDLCCIICGMRVPVILRKTGRENCYKLVGGAFIFGLMEGQAMGNRENWGLEEADIILN